MVLIYSFIIISFTITNFEKKKNVTQKELKRIMIQLKTRILSLVVTIIQVLTRTRYIIL